MIIIPEVVSCTLTSLLDTLKIDQDGQGEDDGHSTGSSTEPGAGIWILLACDHPKRAFNQL